MKSKIFIFLFAILSLIVADNKHVDWRNNLIHWDQAGYHLYLPAIFCYQDLSKLDYYPKMEHQYGLTPSSQWAGITELPNGNRLNKYAVGVAVHELPFFLVAHMIANNNKEFPTDGYSTPYQWASIASTIFWVLMGFVFLRLFLIKRFSDNITLLTLAGIAFATTLYYYTVLNVEMSHTYSFFHFSLILFLTDRLYSRYTSRDIYLLGIALGLAIITRPTNIVAAIIPTLWGVYNYETLVQKIKANLNAKRIGHLLTAGVLCTLITGIQFGYLKYITGDWLYYTYTNEGFVWSQPAILKGLFGFRKGWFVYTPIAFFAVLALFLFYKQHKREFLPIIVFLSITVYITFSWWNWWYGGGYGSRPMTESVAFLSLPLATLLSYISKKGIAVKCVTTILFALFIYLNTFQSYQLSKNVIGYDDMTAEAYYHTLFKTERPKDLEKYLLSDEDFAKEVDKRLNKK